MDRNDDLNQTNGSRTLLVRHLPAELTTDEKEDLLKYFGAESVRVLSSRGRLVCCVTDAEFEPLVSILNSIFIFTETRSLCNIQKRGVSSKSELLM